MALLTDRAERGRGAARVRLASTATDGPMASIQPERWPNAGSQLVIAPIDRVQTQSFIGSETRRP